MWIQAKDIRVEVGKIPKKKEGNVIYFSSFSEMNSVLNQRRVELLNIIKSSKPSSIYELSQLSGKDQGNVSKDIKILEKYGFLTIKKTKEGNRISSMPEYNKEDINLVIKFGAGAFGIAKDALSEVAKEFKGKNLEKNKAYTKKTLKEFTKPIKHSIKKAAQKVDKSIKED